MARIKIVVEDGPSGVTLKMVSDPVMDQQPSPAQVLALNLMEQMQWFLNQQLPPQPTNVVH